MNTRLIVDGLWHCLCPSFDAAAVTTTRSLPKPFTVHSSKSKPRRLQLCHRKSIHTTAHPQAIQYSAPPTPYISPTANDLTARDHARQRHFPNPPKSVAEIAEESAIDKALIQHYVLPDGRRILADSLHYIPVDQLHDVLRHLRNEASAVLRVKDLVRHLVKERNQKPCLLYYDSLIRVNADAAYGSADTVNQLLQDMARHGIVGDSSLFHSVLQVLANHPDHLLRSQVLAEMKERWFDLSNEGWHNVVVGLLRDRQYEMAIDRLEHMHKQNMHVQPWLYDIFIYQLCDVNELDEALRILQYRVDQGDITISPNVWYYMLDICSTNYHYAGTLYIWQRRISSLYLHPSDGTLTNILSLAARFCDTALATDVVRVLTPRTSKLDVHHYECLLAAFAGAGDLKTAFRILSIMKRAQLEPSDGATRPIYSFLLDNHQTPGQDLSTGDPDSSPQTDALAILTSLHQDGHPIPVAAINVVLSVEVQKSPLSHSIALYKNLHHLCATGPNISTFNILLGGCAKAEERITSNHPTSPVSTEAEQTQQTQNLDIQPGYGKSTAMFLASEISALDIRANMLTYDRIILTCLSDTLSPSESYDDALLYLSEARLSFGVPPPPPPDSLSPTPPPQKEKRGKRKLCTPLRAGTWKSLITYAEKVGDERVWEFLDEMERLGLPTLALRREVETRWEARKRRVEEGKRLARAGKADGYASYLETLGV